MGPREAAFAVGRYFRPTSIFVPMHYKTWPMLEGTREEFLRELRVQGVRRVKVLDPFKF